MNRRDAALHAGFAAVLFAGWVAAAATTVLPGPRAVVDALVAQTRSGELPAALAQAVLVSAAGFALAVAVGVPVGVVMGVDARVRALFDPLLTALYVTPLAALVPALVVWFGPGRTVKVAVVFLFAVFPVAINTLEGARTVPPDLVAAARSFGADRRFLLRHVVLPHEAASVMTGLRLGVGRAVKGLVVAELLVSVSGFGGIITRWSAALDLGGVVSVVLVLMALGVGATALLRLVERRLFPWAARD